MTIVIFQHLVASNVMSRQVMLGGEAFRLLSSTWVSTVISQRCREFAVSWLVLNEYNIAIYSYRDFNYRLYIIASILFPPLFFLFLHLYQVLSLTLFQELKCTEEHLGLAYAGRGVI